MGWCQEPGTRKHLSPASPDDTDETAPTGHISDHRDHYHIIQAGTSRRYGAVHFSLDSHCAAGLDLRTAMHWVHPNGVFAIMTRAADLLTIPARHGASLQLSSGQSVEIVNTYGSQAVDTWAFCASDPTEFISMEHTRSRLSRTIPQISDGLFTTRRRVILTMTGDTSPGIHDTLLCACSPELYQELGCSDDHRSCQGNLHEALAAIGISVGFTPAPLNLFMNVAVGPGAEVIRAAPRSKPGDAVTLRAEIDAVVVLSACPQDVTPINGDDCTPRDVGYRIF